MDAYTTTEAMLAPVEPAVTLPPHPFVNFGKEFGWHKRGEIKQLPGLAWE